VRRTGLEAQVLTPCISRTVPRVACVARRGGVRTMGCGVKSAHSPWFMSGPPVAMSERTINP